MEVDSSGTGSPNLTKSDKRTLKTVFVTLAVVIALVIFGSGAYYFGTRQNTKSSETSTENTESEVLGTEESNPSTPSAVVPTGQVQTATPSSSPAPSVSPVPTLKINLKPLPKIPLQVIPTNTPTPAPTINLQLQREIQQIPFNPGL